MTLEQHKVTFVFERVAAMGDGIRVFGGAKDVVTSSADASEQTTVLTFVGQSVKLVRDDSVT